MICSSPGRLIICTANHLNAANEADIWPIDRHGHSAGIGLSAATINCRRCSFIREKPGLMDWPFSAVSVSEKLMTIRLNNRFVRSCRELFVVSYVCLRGSTSCILTSGFLNMIVISALDLNPGLFLPGSCALGRSDMEPAATIDGPTIGGSRQAPVCRCQEPSHIHVVDLRWCALTGFRRKSAEARRSASSSSFPGYVATGRRIRTSRDGRTLV